MTPGREHSIQKLAIDLVTSSRQTGLSLQKELPDTLERDLFPRMNQLFDLLAPEEELVIDRIDIDLGSKSLEGLQQQLSNDILHHLEEQVRKRKSRIKKADQKSRQYELIDSFFFILNNGQVPWWAPQIKWNETETEILNYFSSPGNRYWKKLRKQLKKNPTILSRLVFHFSDSFLLDLFGQFAPQRAKGINELFQEWSLLFQPVGLDERVLRNTFWHSIYFLVARRSVNYVQTEEGEFYPELIRQMLFGLSRDSVVKSILKRNEISPTYRNLLRWTRGRADPLPNIERYIEAVPIRTPRTRASTPAKESIESSESSWFVDHAGLVLLHPYLEYLFLELDWMKNQKFRSDAARHRAVRLLTYLAVGEGPAPKAEPILAKLFCGLDFEVPTDPKLNLDERWKKEADTLTGAVIKHWKILKDTSPEGLRQSFLQRPGKLIRQEDNNWRLEVEPASYDMLLDHLPWGFGIIKLPWIKEMIIVNW